MSLQYDAVTAILYRIDRNLFFSYSCAPHKLCKSLDNNSGQIYMFALVALL
jgi:hypothetical protein